MRTLTPFIASVVLLSASSALADGEPRVASARVVSYESAESLTRKVCDLVAIADVGKHARLFDIAVDGQRCSSLTPEHDSIPLRVRLEPQANGWRNVVFEADVQEGTSFDAMNTAVDGAARELFQRLGGTPPPRKVVVHEPARKPEPVKAAVNAPADGYITPTFAPYEGGSIPKDAKIVTQPNMAFLGTGIGLFAASYGGALIYALSTCSAQEACRPGSSFLYIPFVGPLMTAIASETPTTGGRALAAFDGGVQLLSGALAVASFAWPKKFVMWQSKSASVQVVPTTMGAGTSAGVAVTVTHF